MDNWIWSFTSSDDVPEIQVEFLSVFTTISSLLSLLGSSFIIVSVFHPHLRTRFHGLLQFMSIADMFCSLSYIIGQYDSVPTCTFQTLGVQYFSVCSMLWTSAIALYLHYQVRTTKNRRLVMFELICHVICWGYPFINTVLPLALGAYNFKPPWCDMYDRYWYFRIIHIYVPEIITVAFISFNYLGIIFKLRKTIIQSIFPFLFKKSDEASYIPIPSEEREDEEEEDAFHDYRVGSVDISETVDEAEYDGKPINGGISRSSLKEKIAPRRILRSRARYSLYLAVYLICWAPTIVKHLISNIFRREFFVLLLILAILQPLQGFGNFLVYILNPEVRGVCLDILLLRFLRGTSRRTGSRISIRIDSDSTITRSEEAVVSTKKKNVSLGAGLEETFGVMRIDEDEKVDENTSK